MCIKIANTVKILLILAQKSFSNVLLAGSLANFAIKCLPHRLATWLNAPKQFQVISAPYYSYPYHAVPLLQVQCTPDYWLPSLVSLLYFIFGLLLLLSGDVELNPGPVTGIYTYI